MGPGSARRVAAGGPAPVRALDAYRRRPTGEERTARVGMAVFLGSWAMLFAALFFAYAVVRGRSPGWPPPGVPPLPRVLPGVNTAVIAASSAAVAWAADALARGRPRRVPAALAAAAALGAAFLALQAVGWAGAWRAGLVPSGGPYPSVFYALTAFHALHVLVGLGALGVLALRARAARATRTGVRLWGWYWHFVGAIWGVLYVALYLG